MSFFVLLLALLFQAPTAGRQQLGVVTGVLRTDSGVPLDGIRVAVKPVGATATDDLLESLAQTDKDGRYRLENVSPGRYYIVVGRGFNAIYHPGLPGVERATTILVTAGATTEVPVMIFARTKVSGRVVDMVTGEARRVQSVILCCDDSSLVTSSAAGTTLITVTPLTATVGDDGTFSFPAVPPGNYSIHLADPEILPVSQAIAVGDSDVAGVEVKVSAGVEVQGGLVDRHGKAISGVQVRLRRRPTNALFESLTSLGPTNGGVLLLRPTGTTTSYRLSLTELNAALAQSSKIYSVPVVGGRFSLSRVLPGSYVVEIVAPGGHSMERQIEVATRGVTTLQLEMPLAQVTGRIVAAVGEALPGLPGSIRFVGVAAGERIVYAYPDAEGRFSALLEAGEYRVFTENLGPRVHSVADGAKDLGAEPFVFDGVRSTDLLITLD